MMPVFLIKPYLFFAAAVFLLPLQKRKWWTLRFFGGLAAFITLTYLGAHSLFHLENFSFEQISHSYSLLLRNFHLYVQTMLLIYVAELFIIAALSLFCCKISLWEAIYASACGFTLRQLCSAVITLLQYQNHDFSYQEAYRSLHPEDFFVHLIFYLFCYFFIARRLAEKGHYDVNFGMTLVSVLVVLGLCLWLSMIAQGIYQLDHSPQFVISQLFLLLCCIFVLWVQIYQKTLTRLKVSMETERLLRKQQMEQYTLSKENAEIIQLRCHDLKHQIAALRTMEHNEKWEKGLGKIEDSIASFSATAQSGNETLDIVLTQKSLTCLKKHIKYTFMTDGALLSFMDPMDLFLLFGNALDNAIENVEHLPDEKKVIAVILQKKGDMIFLQFENYYEQPLQEKEGLFATSKKKDKDSHGYGLLSMKRLVQQYGGTMSISTREHIFMVSILFPESSGSKEGGKKSCKIQ